MSPCLGICALDEELVCLGCRRTVDEIKSWARLTPAEQWRLVDTELPAREASRKSL